MDNELVRFIELAQNPSVNVNATDPKDGMNALLKLTRNYGHDNLVQLLQPLIENGIDINATDLNGWNAIHNLCAYYGHNNFPDLILLLKENNIDMKALTNEGDTAFSLTSLKNTSDMAWKHHAIAEIIPIDKKCQEFSEVKYIPF